MSRADLDLIRPQSKAATIGSPGGPPLERLANGLAEPFVFLGPVRMRSCRGERPMQIEWDPETAMPEWLYERAAVLGR